MRVILGVLFFVFMLSASLLAQDVDSTNEFSIYNYKPTKRDRVILEVNHTGWLGAPSGIEIKPLSGGVNFYMYFDHPIGKSHFSWAWGGGISSYNVHGNHKLIYQTDETANKVVFTDVVKRDEPYYKNRLGLKVLEIPIEIRFRNRHDFQFKCMLGFKAGYVVQSFRKIFDQEGKMKIYRIHGINPIRYGVYFRMGWEQLHLTAFYAFSEMFLKNKGTPGIIPFSIGFAYTPRISLGTGAK